ncbi:MAG: hypothetical protein GF335_04380 [Candidatus Moranbacteria bacterium]|nr:hypothetical protein [Candidatus Moranbacteria bacterium]
MFGKKKNQKNNQEENQENQGFFSKNPSQDNQKNVDLSLNQNQNLNSNKKVQVTQDDSSQNKGLKKIIGIGIGSVVGAINFTKDAFGKSLSKEEIVRYAEKYNEILKRKDMERREAANEIADKYKKFADLYDSDKNTNKEQQEIIPQINNSIDKLIQKSKEYHQLDPEDPLFDATVPRLEKTKSNLREYLNILKSKS